LKGSREGGDAQFGHLGVSKSDDTQRLYFVKAFSDLDETFVADRIVVQIQLTQLELILEHFA
jgi:hypothetical protein